MNKFLETIKQNIEAMESDYMEKGDTPLSMVDKSILDENNITLEEFIEYVNPYCTSISSHVISSKENNLCNIGAPEGAHIRLFMLVGHDEETKKSLWNVYESEDALYDNNFFMSQLYLYKGTKIVKSKVCISTEEGPAFQEKEY